MHQSSDSSLLRYKVPVLNGRCDGIALTVALGEALRRLELQWAHSRHQSCPPHRCSSEHLLLSPDPVLEALQLYFPGAAQPASIRYTRRSVQKAWSATMCRRDIKRGCSWATWKMSPPKWSTSLPRAPSCPRTSCSTVHIRQQILHREPDYVALRSQMLLSRVL